jgi:hypothetical protein
MTTERTTERTKDVVVPLIGTGFAFIASLISVLILLYTHHRSIAIEAQLYQIQQTQFVAAQTAQAEQFNRESARQYVTLVYVDLTSKDVEKQRAALSLLEILEPSTALKLLVWANKASVILPENKEQSMTVERALESLNENGRFRIFLHLGKSGSRSISSEADIKKTLSSMGFRVVGTDTKVHPEPGVDYFYDSDKAGAEQVASMLNEIRDPNDKPVIVRNPQSANDHPLGTLGVWF